LTDDVIPEQLSLNLELRLKRGVAHKAIVPLHNSLFSSFLIRYMNALMREQLRV